MHNLFVTTLVYLFTLFMLSCGEQEEDSNSNEASSEAFDEDGFLEAGVGFLKIGVATTGGEANSTGLRLAEPTTPTKDTTMVGMP